jgi:DNA-binding beta-propeller fold protein YncE
MNRAEVTLSSGPFRYKVIDDWAQLPPGWSLNDVGGVAIDRDDRVYVFNRGERPVIIFDRDGKILDSWGEGLFTRPHGAHIGADNLIYLTDDGDHTVRKCTLDGKVLLTIGVPGQPSPPLSLRPFNRCTHTALSPEGDIYVSDGYGNARVHKYSPEGKLVISWGEFGVDPGQFNVPHNICCDAEGWVYVADRESHRVQVFSGTGQYETQWNNLHRPCALCMDDAREPLFYIGELPPLIGINNNYPNLGPRVTIANKQGEILAHLGGVRAGNTPGEFTAPHGMAVDSRGDIYVGEVSFAIWPQLFPNTPIPIDLRSLRKLVKIVQDV